MSFDFLLFAPRAEFTLGYRLNLLQLSTVDFVKPIITMGFVPLTIALIAFVAHSTSYIENRNNLR